VAVSGVEIDFYSYHLRKKELEQIAKAVGAKLVLMERGAKGSEDEVEVGKGQRAGSQSVKRLSPFSHSKSTLMNP